MSLDKVITDIEKTAEQEAKAILEQARRAEKEMVADARRRLAEQQKRVREQTGQRLAQIATRAAVARKMKMRDAEMQAKKALIDKVYDRFAGTMLKKKETWYAQLFQLAKKQLPSPHTVYLSAGDVRLGKKLFRGLRIGQTDTRGGFILESRDGRERVDVRLEALVDALKERTLKDVSEILFGRT